jgi:hypothetical protein
VHFKLVLLEGNDESALSKKKGNFLEIVDLLAEFTLVEKGATIPVP